jgi:predicted lipid-binding transport protein (Tim44 family)
MKKVLAALAIVCMFAAGALAAEPADTKQAPAAPCPMMSGQQAAPGANPHAGHQMPAQGGQGGMMGGGMMGGKMGGGMMNCPMKKNMGEMMTMLKEVMVIQDALLKGVGAKEKKALQGKLTEMMKKIDDMKAAPMSCPMMQMMDHSKHQPAPAPAAAPAATKEPAKPAQPQMPNEHKH